MGFGLIERQTQAGWPPLVQEIRGREPNPGPMVRSGWPGPPFGDFQSRQDRILNLRPDGGDGARERGLDDGKRVASG